MRRASRGIVIKDNQLLVMHRNKFGEQYDTLPGGNIEIGETPEQALVRELAEETSIVFKNSRLVFIEHSGEPYGDQYIFLCEYQSGQPALQPGSEEDLIHKMGKNLYEPQWLPLSELPDRPFLSTQLKAALLEALAKGWPKKTIEISK